MRIYVNGKPSAIHNIFKPVEKYGIVTEDAVSKKAIGRNYDDVLNDWINTNKTYYYIGGKCYNFELK